MDDISALLKGEQFSFSYIEQYIVGKYTWEIEKKCCLPFLDVLLTRSEINGVCVVYPKATVKD